MSRKKRLQKKAEKGRKAEAKRQVYQAKIATKSKAKKKTKKVIPEGKVFIQSSFNNTFITITDPTGAVIAWGSSGSAGFKGSRKSAATKAVELGMIKVEVFVKGVGSGRDAAIRSLDAGGLTVVGIKDVTPLPHNGPRPRKARRV